jgi:hypothetical protein
MDMIGRSNIRGWRWSAPFASLKRPTSRVADMTSKSRWSARRGLLGLVIVAALALLVVPVATASAAIVITEPPAGETTGAKPKIAGTTEDALLQVNVAIYETGVTGPPLETVPGPFPSEGKWSVTAGPLGTGEYTAVAEQGLGLSLEVSEPVSFKVDASSPKVTLKGPKSPWGGRTPSFTGTASATTKVIVHIHEGETVEGPEVSTASANGTGSAWTSSEASPELASGKHTYTAVATQESPVGNPAGKSEPVTFEVNTNSPVVTLDKVPSPTKDTTPTFSGTAEPGQVILHVFEGPAPEGKVAATLEATPSAGKWTATPSTALSDGTYTAVAEEPSAIGNPPGKSEPQTFVVDTSSPEVTLEAPASPSNDREPAFTGTASAETEVVVHIFEGATEVAKATALGTGGPFSSGVAGPALPTGEHTFTAYATQKSPLGNPEGKSKTVSFVVDTEPPEVTLNKVESPSKNTTPSFSGTAEGKPVTVKIYSGPKAAGSPIATEEASVSGHSWGPVNSATFVEGTYTAVAEEESSLGNGVGKSEEIPFAIVTKPPKVTLNKVESPSSDTTPSFSGTATGSKSVTVKVYKGMTAEGPVVATAEAPVKAKSWGPVKSATVLGEGTYTAVAEQESSLGNGMGTSEEQHFTIITKAPKVVLNEVKSPSNVQTPSFSGTASEANPVTVKVFKGLKAEGPVVATVEVPVASNNWGPASSSTVLNEGTYTAIAEEESSLGNGIGKSSPVTFEIITKSPKIVLNELAESKDTTPSFSGTTNETEPVTVKVYKGTKAEGPVLETLSATVKGGAWSTANSAKALADGVYSAAATEPSSVGNPEGKSNIVIFVVKTTPPEVTLNEVASPSGNATPSFSGTASETEPVTVRIYKGSKAQGSPVASTQAEVSSRKWSTAPLAKALAEGEYTAVAEEESSLGNGAGKSGEQSFTIIKTPPKVTLEGPASRSNDTTPSFSGTASETKQVTLKIYKGEKAEGPVVATAEAKVTNHNWGPASSTTILSEGTYSAVAEEESSLGNGVGKSPPVIFTVITAPPKVTLKPVSSPSGNTKPSFSGTASESKAVTVKVYKGSKAEGPIVATAEGALTGENWGPVSSATALAEGTYTAVAEEESSLGNGAGKSSPVTFTIITKPPEVTLEGPESPSNHTTPSFKGTASETKPVTVKVYKGPKAEGSVVVTAQASVEAGHNWGPVSGTGVLAEGEYTAVAEEESSFGNGPGKSSEQHFQIITKAPKVTLKPVASPSNVEKPTFSGTASETRPVTVKIYKGSKAQGIVVATAEANVTGESWGPASSTTALGEGEYTAVAEEESSAGNGPGKSGEQHFDIVTKPPTVTLKPVASPSNNETPAFSGTANETNPVVVKIYKGPKAEGSVVATAEAKVAGESWGPVSSATRLGEGEYTALAEEESSAGNGPGKSGEQHFEIITKTPKVTLKPVATPSNNETPAFSGTASETKPVTVKVYKGGKAEGSVIATAEAKVAGESWGPVSSATKLGEGEYTAVAEEESSAGNGPGMSDERHFLIIKKPPKVTLKPVTSPSNNETPSLSGTASETPPVFVKVYKGPKAEGPVVATAEAKVAGESWGPVSSVTRLGEGEYTAVAEEESAAGNVAGKSEEQRFKIITKPPKVTLKPVTSPSKTETPSFSGTASESNPVIVKVYKGPKAEGSVVATAEGKVAGESWGPVSSTTALGESEYTAVAEEESSLGNGPGKSEEQHFKIITKPPTVTLKELFPPTKRGNKNEPTFEGTASEVGTVTVHVFKGPEAKGEEAASLKATVAEGKWAVAPTTPLADGEYTAIAIEPSSVGVGEGKSETQTFKVDTKPPAVTLKELFPPTKRGNVTKPPFEGTASEAGTVTVHVFKGGEAKGEEAATLTATASEGKWGVTPATALADGPYTAVATEPSAIGNEEGKSEAQKFEINTKAPVLTCEAPQLRSSNSTPSFSGGSTEAGVVTVRIYKESKSPANEVATLLANVSGEKWTTAHVSPALTEGPYVEVASEPSRIAGNPAGSCEVPLFEIAGGVPEVRLNAVTSPSNNEAPAFSGSSNEKAKVKVEVFEGTQPEGNVVAIAEGAVSGGGTWTSGPVTPHLPSGKHLFTAVARQKSELQNVGEGVSKPVTFEVDTTPPTVVLNAVLTPSKNNKPSFSGSASDPKEKVTVNVYSGSKVAGTPVATVTTSVTEKRWSTAALPTALKDGEYTAVASQRSSIGNPEGQSAPITFKISTAPVVVTLNQIPSPTSDAAPTFSGTASDPKERVIVQIYSGPAAEGAPVATVEAHASGGNWTSGVLQTPLEDGEYTAVATQLSSLGNKSGSASMTFVVEVPPPTIAEVSSSANRSSAIMNASIDANGGRLGVCRFEYGTTTEFGKEAQCAFSFGGAECAFESHPNPGCQFPTNQGVASYARVFRLTPGTAYFFRVIAENEGGKGNAGVAEGEFRTADRPNEEPPPPKQETLPAKTSSSGVSQATIASLLLKQLAPSGKGAKIANLLKLGFYKELLKAPAAGNVALGWYYLPPGASLSKKSRHGAKPVLVASVKHTFASASSATLKLRLTAAGRRLLLELNRVKLTAKCVFTPTGQTAITTLKTFTLKH